MMVGSLAKNSTFEEELKIEVAVAVCNNTDVPDREASGFKFNEAMKLENAESKVIDYGSSSFKGCADSTPFVTVGESDNKVGKGMIVPCASTDGSLVLMMSSNRPRPIAKRDWPPGCGPSKEKRRRQLDVDCSGSFAVHDQKRQKVKSEIEILPGMNLCMDVVTVKKKVEFLDNVFSKNKVEQHEMPNGTLETLTVGDGGEPLEISVEKEDQNEPMERRVSKAEVMDVVTTQACKPVAMKTLPKRNPTSSNVKVNYAELPTSIAQRSSHDRDFQASDKDKGDLCSKEIDAECAGNEVYSLQDVRIEEGIVLKKKAKSRGKLTGNSNQSGLKIKKTFETACSIRKVEVSKLKTLEKNSVIPLPEKKEFSEDDMGDIIMFTDDPHDAESRELVRQTLKIFDTIRRKLQRDEEGSAKESAGRKRSDLRAGSLMNARNLSINRVKKIGYVPGVEVGDHFYFRVELCIVGIHRQIQGGIDFISAKENEWGHPVAASITASGGYEDDLDDGETMIYTGQGGNNYKGDRRQQEDQKLERGNLAMENSYKLGLPIRVIRGCRDKSSPSGTIYTYDGLYVVVQSWLDRGVSGFGVYKFKLQRIPGQPPLGSLLVKFVGSLKSKPSKREGVIIPDISKGQEKIPVCVVNEVDDLTPTSDNFHYITSVSIPEGLVKPPPAQGCSCKRSCSSASVCECIQKNGGKAPYVGGLLVEAKNVVYECGLQCGCPLTCQNRVTQYGIKHQLEIFKTKQKGWGVRSWDSIPSGSFICEYIGELVDSQDAEQRVDNDEYLFDLDLIKGNKARGVDVSMFFDEAAKDSNEEVEEANLSIDASKYGNVGRFINHSCSPNLFAQCVLFHHDDLRIPHIMLFAMENIPPLTELTYDYGYTVGQVVDSDGNVKVKACHCGESNCTGRMY